MPGRSSRHYPLKLLRNLINVFKFNLMNYSNLFRIAIRALIRNKLRAFLTMLGIIIGVASVIAMLAIGEGSKQKIRGQISSMGTNMVMVMPNFQRRGGVSLGSSSSMALKYTDVVALRSEATDISSVSPEVRASGQVIYSNQNTQTTIYGVSEEYLSIKKLEIISGRFFNANELKNMSKVCVLGQTVVENLFGVNADPVGLSIRIKNLPFLIIGTLKDKGESGMGQDEDDLILAPYTTVQRRLAAIDYINGIYASALSEEKSPAAIAEVTEILRRTHKLKESAENDFRVMSQSELLKTVSSITDVMTYLLGAIAGISLLVGGIGIMNIMFVSVTERTREIGLRMSIGGRGKDILKQFLAESIILSILGGMIGVIFGYLLARLAGSLMSTVAIVKTQSVFLAFIVCFIIGVFFGWYPARKAANLNPIDALRYE
jgi:putative ABC transport system permease protein